ncbi:MAG: hypothetical protein Q4A60_06705 [Pasteurellaceae bacterium]|nr:hypothetical protein [Pasteurellaceae bacterium]
MEQIQSKITLSKEAERGIILSQLNENSSMLINFNDVAFLTGFGYNKVQRELSKRPDFPKSIDEEVSPKDKLFVSGDVIKWIKRYSPRFK